MGMTGPVCQLLTQIHSTLKDFVNNSAICPQLSVISPHTIAFSVFSASMGFLLAQGLTAQGKDKLNESSKDVASIQQTMDIAN